MKSYVHGTILFTLRIWKLFSRKVALPDFSAICPELSTTMFVLIKKDDRKTIGRTIRSPCITRIHQLITSTNFAPKHKEVPWLTEKEELICISDQPVSIGAIA